MGRAHHPVGQVFHQLVAELHLLAEGQVVATLHHRLDQLAEFRFYVDGVHGHVQVADVTHDGQHHALDAGDAEMFGRLVVFAAVQYVLHYEDDVLDELRVQFGHDHLTLLIEKLIDYRFDLFEQNRIEGGRHLVAHQFFDMFLYLSTKFFVVTDK